MMSEPFQFDYYYGAESDQFSFIRIPKLLLKDPKFLDLSYGAIITYAMLFTMAVPYVATGACL